MVLRTVPFDRFFVNAPAAPLDVYRDGDALHIEIDLPGVDPASIDATIDRDVLTVRAERAARPEGVRSIRTERPTGPVTRRLRLADTLDTERLQASYDAGVLTLRVPVAERARPRKIDITTGNGRELVNA